MKSDQLSRLSYLSKFLWVIAIGVVTLYFGRAVIMPVIFAMFASFALLPFCKSLEERGWNRGITSFSLVLLLSLLICGIIYIIGLQGAALASDLPKLMDSAQELWDSFTGELEELNLPADGELIPEENPAEAVPIGDVLSESASAIYDTLTFFIVTPFYMFFMLRYRANFRGFLIRISRNKEVRENNFKMMSEVGKGVQAYLKGLSLVILFIAVANSVVYLILGLEYAILLAVTSALLTLVPYIGVFIGALIPTAIAIITKDSLTPAIVVVISAAAIQFIEGNFLTPKIIGDQAQLNPMFILLSISVLGLIGGVLGMILAAPLITVTKIICEHFEPLKPIAILLSSDREKEKVDRPTDVEPA